MIIFFDFNFFNAEHTYMSSKSSTFVDVKPVMLTYSWPLTSREFNNMLIFSTLRAYKVETHNLEVLGSSPRWPTFFEKHLRVIASAFFFSNLVIYKPYWLVWRIGCKSTIEILMPLEHPILVILEHSILVTEEHPILMS